jgi:hypothetical protein
MSIIPYPARPWAIGGLILSLLAIALYMAPCDMRIAGAVAIASSFMLAIGALLVWRFRDRGTP